MWPTHAQEQVGLLMCILRTLNFQLIFPWFGFQSDAANEFVAGALDFFHLKNEKCASYVEPNATI